MNRHLPAWYEWPLLVVFVPLILGGVLAGMVLFWVIGWNPMGVKR